MAYGTLADVRAILTSSATYSDAAVNAALARTTAPIDQFTGQFFDARSKSLTVDGEGAHLLRLYDRSDDGRVAAARIVSVSQVDTTNGIYTTLIPAYAYTAKVGWFAIRLRNITQDWDEGCDNYVVTGTFGYSSVPADVQRAAVLLAIRDLETGLVLPSSKFHADESNSSMGGASSSKAPHVYDFTHSTGDADADRLLSPWRRRMEMRL